jgi:hypothetical protein
MTLSWLLGPLNPYTIAIYLGIAAAIVLLLTIGHGEDEE